VRDSPTRKPDRGNGSTLWVHEMFVTIQGEGPLVGTKAVFIRLGGCNLACNWCDTVYEGSSWWPTIDEIVTRADSLNVDSPMDRHVVITGGEPLRQEVGPLISELLTLGYHVQIETSGSLWPRLGVPEGAMIVVSPKTPKVHPKIKERASAWKYVLEAGRILSDGLPDASPTGGISAPVARPPVGSDVYVQPCWPISGDESQAQSNTDQAVRSVLMHGYRLSLQTHRILGLP